MRFPYWALQTIAKNIRIVESMQLIVDPRFFYPQRVVHCQRQVNDIQAQYILQFLKPLSDQIGFWLRWEVDDVIFHEDIPPYNMGRAAFDNKQFFANVSNILQAVDIVTVTTDLLKDYYVSKCNIDHNKVIVLPNYLPRWWIGQAYNLDQKKQQLEKNKKRPKILLPLSSSHYDLDGSQGYKDDFEIIANFVRATCKKYEWMVVGHCPKLIEDLIMSQQVTVVPGSDLLNYPRETSEREPQLIVAPLRDNTFNRCKSCIKLVESWALGIPAIVQDLPCYSTYTDSTFKDMNQLQDKIDGLLRDPKKYERTIKQNRNTVDYGDSISPNGWWMEKNLQGWFNLFTIPQKSINADIRSKKPEVQEEGVIIDLSK